VRADEKVARETFRFSVGWKQDGVTGRTKPEIDHRLAGGRFQDGKFVAHSLSGNERNHLFFNHHGESFEDISALSGLDNPADGRGFVLWDYDHDGWQDIAMVNANVPLLNFYHNEIPSVLADSHAQPGNMIAIRFVGGNRSPDQNHKFACRDGYGAMVIASLGDTILKREHRCGEGFATQNSSTLILGIGPRTSLPSLSVRWPSGKIATTQNIPATTLVTVYENPQDAPGGKPFIQVPYSPAKARPPATSSAEAPSFPLNDLFTSTAPAASPTDPKLLVFTTMATWCTACIEHVPEMKLLTSTLSREGVEFIGVPVDENDTTAKLEAFRNKWLPPYNLLADLPAHRRRSVVDFLKRMTGNPNPGVPSTVLTDPSGKVLLVGAGVPSVSIIRKLLLQP